MSVSITLEDDIDISRGDMIVKENNQAEVSQDLDIMMCWFNAKKFSLALSFTSPKHQRSTQHSKGRYCIKWTSTICSAWKKTRKMGMNDIVRVKIRTTKPVAYDPYRKNRSTGSVVLTNKVPTKQLPLA